MTAVLVVWLATQAEATAWLNARRVGVCYACPDAAHAGDDVGDGRNGFACVETGNPSDVSWIDAKRACGADLRS